MIDLSDAQAAYLAGLIDGEGSVECQRQMQPRGQTPRFVLRLSFVFATAEPVTTVAHWLGLEPKVYPARDERRQSRHRLHIPKSLAIEVLDRCLPYLLLKGPQAQAILEIEAVRSAHSPDRTLFGSTEGRHGASAAMPATAVAEMERLHALLRSMKSNKRVR